MLAIYQFFRELIMEGLRSTNCSHHKAADVYIYLDQLSAIGVHDVQTISGEKIFGKPLQVFPVLIMPCWQLVGKLVAYLTFYLGNIFLGYSTGLCKTAFLTGF